MFISIQIWLLKIKTITFDLNNTLDEINFRLDIAEENIHELEDIAIETKKNMTVSAIGATTSRMLSGLPEHNKIFEEIIVRIFSK